MSGLTVFEFDHIHACAPGVQGHAVPLQVFEWLERQSVQPTGEERASWLRPSRSLGRRAIQVTDFVGVIRAPGGFQIEVLPKVGRVDGTGYAATRRCLLEMLRCLEGFRHIRMDRAAVASERMPMLEVFVREFLLSVEHVVKRGPRSAYVSEIGQLRALRGRLVFSEHLKQNRFRADRFFAEYDIYSLDRPENRIIRAALRLAQASSSSHDSQKLARELSFVFSDVPDSKHIELDFQRVSLDRSMTHYDPALAWARLLLEGLSPLVASGRSIAPSLLFPMAAVFEAYVAKHLASQLSPASSLRTQVRGLHLVKHRDRSWFRLQPDLLIQRNGAYKVVLDTKWKVLDVRKADGGRKYELSQADFYQLYAYGNSYLDGEGDVVLIYPKTEQFAAPLPVFDFPKAPGLRLWVLPFCLQSRRLIVPPDSSLSTYLRD